MRTQDVKIGEVYRLVDHPQIGFAKPVRKLAPGEAPNTKTYTIFECEHTAVRNGTLGYIRYFRASALMK